MILYSFINESAMTFCYPLHLFLYCISFSLNKLVCLQTPFPLLSSSDKPNTCKSIIGLKKQSFLNLQVLYIETNERTGNSVVPLLSLWLASIVVLLPEMSKYILLNVGYQQFLPLILFIALFNVSILSGTCTTVLPVNFILY